MFKRILLFALTNIAVLVMLSIIMAICGKVFGISFTNESLFGIALFSLLFGFLGAFISLFLSRWSAKRIYDIVLIDTKNKNKASPKEQKSYELVAQLALQNKISMPEFGIYIDPEVNAFATGYSKNKSLIALSTGLLEQCTLSEIEGIIAHEMSHVLSGDMITMTLLQGVLNTFVLFISRVAARAIDEATDGKLGWIGSQMVYLLLQVILGIFATLIVMKFSRYREFRADEGSAKLVGKNKMIAALKRLESLQKFTSKTNEAQLATFKISTNDTLSLFASHPSITLRIKALEENYQLN